MQNRKSFVPSILALSSLLMLLLSASQSQSQGVPTYELSFCTPGQPIGSILYVGQELILHAYVADNSGTPASGGGVIFQVCTRGGDFHQDPQPSSACDIDKTATWRSLHGLSKVPSVSPSCLEQGCPPAGPGNACGFWGAVANPRTIGFRFKYLGQGSGIANDISDPKDVSWIALPSP
jgi:hypothetical protein